jgi:hypothetical protein
VATQPLSHLTIGQLVDVAAERWPDAEALVSVYQGLRLTFGEAREKVSLSRMDDICSEAGVGGCDCDKPTCEHVVLLTSITKVWSCLQVANFTALCVTPV